MSKIIGPLIGLEAKGKLGKKLIYQKRPKGQAVYSYHKPGSKQPFEISPKQKDQRGIIGLITAHWQCMSPAEKQFWEDKAKKIGFKGSGYHLFLKTASKDLTRCLGLVGYWSFNYNVGDKVFDLSGNENHGILKPSYPTNCPVFKDSIDKKFGKCLEFNGEDNYVDCGNAESLQNITKEITVVAWVKPDRNTWNSAIEKRSGGNSWVLFAPNDTKKVVFFIYQDDGTLKVVASNTILQIGQWYHIVGVADGKEIAVYLNGKLDCTPVAYNGTIRKAPSPVLIGHSILSGRFFKGLIDEVRIYNRGLSPEEIHYQYNLFRR